jgi:tetratricopeptide (TPR) repeat protein
MSNIITELKDRGVLRAAGLYIAGVWLFLQIADVLFPAFDIPDSTVRYLLYGAFGVFPFAMMFAWFYEITGEGVQLESEISESGETRNARTKYSHLAIVIMLVLALGISLFFNVQQAADQPEKIPDNISLLIADTVNSTGDPIFDSVLEQALAIGLESSSFIASYPRHLALRTSGLIGEGADLGEERARLVAIREGIKLVVLGSVAKVDEGFKLTASALDAESGESVVDTVTAIAKDKAEVLRAVSTLSDEIRESLGDITLEQDTDRETFTAASLQAVSFYTRAQAQARLGNNAEAIELYRKATEEDPNFGRAYSGWALAEFNGGRQQLAEELWKKTLTLMDGMTERERYRTTGLYYSIVSRNYPRAIENYEMLVEKYPADSVARNNLAVVYFFDRQFDKASREGEAVVEMYPRNALFRTNLALYAMYAGQFELAAREASEVLAIDTSFYKAYFPQAIAALAAGDSASAIEIYQAMATHGDNADSLAQIGLADVALLEGRYQAATEILKEAIARDVAAGNERAVAHKLAALAIAQWRNGDAEAAMHSAAGTVDSRSLIVLVPVARLYVEMGRLDEARAVADSLKENLQMAARANVSLINGNIKLAEGDFAAALDAMTDSIERVDTWGARFDRGRVYAAAGLYAEAMADLESCLQRIGEASALGLDDSPTFMFTARLYYWLGVSKQHLGMASESRQALETFLGLRQEGDNNPLVVDARERLQNLPPAN